MLRWIGNALASTIGRKFVVGLSGLMLVGFLVEHLIGNVTLYTDPSGEAFNEYVAYFKSFGPLLIVAEVGLALLFACHIVLAIRLSLENRQARRDGYVVRGNRGAQTFGSVSMFVTGALILGYLVKHLIDFRFDARFEEDPAAVVAATLGQPGHALAYVAAAILVGIHLSHGFRSAFQSLGISHPKLDPLLVIGGRALAVLFALGFASFPLYFLFFWSEGGHA
jgi:succinate dehydrogenase / fumarate reductase cytochrome b subunit